MRLFPRRLTGIAAGAALVALSTAALAGASPAAPKAKHGPGWVRDPSRPLGVHDPKIPIDHIVIVMQENHSFDEYFGMLPANGQPKADGFTFDSHGQPTNSNPLAKGGIQKVFPHASYCSGPSAGQGWTSTHKEINGGRMDGFAKLEPRAMSYYTRQDLPFYYSLATNYTLANRWFASAPAQTYPNRRFLYAGTAYGNISTDTSSYFDAPPPHGTIQDSMVNHGVTWKDYATDLPDTALIGSNIKTHPTDYASIAQFYVDAKLGILPAVSYIESDGGVASVAVSPVDDAVSKVVPEPTVVKDNVYRVKAVNGDEEDANVRVGQKFVSRIVKAVTTGAAWDRTLLIWLYDEHGGFYDHVPSPRAIAPDAIKPKLSKTDIRGGYDQFGVRVPAVVISPYSRPHAVTNVMHDHTSILAMIERVWNLPALTYRDANATDLMDFLDLHKPAMLTPPALADPGPVNLSTCHAGQ